MQVPAHWEHAGLPVFAAAVRFERCFEVLALKPGESLWLVCRGVNYLVGSSP
jgi:hypothetical protein